MGCGASTELDVFNSQQPRSKQNAALNSSTGKNGHSQAKQKKKNKSRAAHSKLAQIAETGQTGPLRQPKEGLRATGYRAEILHFLSDPLQGEENSYQHVKDGIVVVKEGQIVACGSTEEIMREFDDQSLFIHDCRPGFIMPGFVNAHAQFPQHEIVARQGNRFMEWLKDCKLPSEAGFSDVEHSNNAAERWVRELLRNGTTTAMATCGVHEAAVEALFTEAKKNDMLVIAGNAWMDSADVQGSTMNAEASYELSERLIKQWHGNGRCLFAVAPRSAATSSPEQLRLAGKLLSESDGVYLHTQLDADSEEREVAKSKHNAASCLEAFDKAGLVTPKSVFAHAVHSTGDDWVRIATVGAAVVHCPSANMALGCGLFPIDAARKHTETVAVGLGSDVGPSACVFRTLSAAYKVAQLQQVTISPMALFYMATLGSAKALSVDHRVGNFERGKDADFVVLEFASTPLMAHRTKLAGTLQERLFLLTILGDDRQVSCNTSFSATLSVPETLLLFTILTLGGNLTASSGRRE